jgi:hypothetical protein
MVDDRTVKWLGGALALQLGLAAFTCMPRGGGAAAEVDLVDLPREALTRIELHGGPEDEDPLVLAREGEVWTLPELGAYPAAEAKVVELLDQVDALVGRAPIATQATSHGSLGVAADAFGRKLVLSDGASTRTVLLGAAGGKSVHARVDGEDAVYAVRGPSLWSFSDSARAYYEAEVLAVETGALERVSVVNPAGGVQLVRDASGWSLPDAPEGAALDRAAVDRLVRKLASVRMSAPVAREARPEHGLDGGTRVEWAVEVDGASEPGGLTLGAEDGADLFLRVDGAPFVVKVPKAGFDEWRTVTAGALLGAP